MGQANLSPKTRAEFIDLWNRAANLDDVAMLCNTTNRRVASRAAMYRLFGYSLKKFKTGPKEPKVKL